MLVTKLQNASRLLVEHWLRQCWEALHLSKSLNDVVGGHKYLTRIKPTERTQLVTFHNNHKNTLKELCQQYFKQDEAFETVLPAMRMDLRWDTLANELDSARRPHLETVAE